MFNVMMAVNIASKDPPMTLGRRQALQQVCIPLRVLPHETVFMPKVGDVLSKQVGMQRSDEFHKAVLTVFLAILRIRGRYSDEACRRISHNRQPKTRCMEIVETQQGGGLEQMEPE